MMLIRMRPEVRGGYRYRRDKTLEAKILNLMSSGGAYSLESIVRTVRDDPAIRATEAEVRELLATLTKRELEYYPIANDVRGIVDTKYTGF